MNGQVHEIHGEVPDAANGVVTRLTVATADVATTRGPYDKSKNAVAAWEEKYKTKTGKEPGVKDRYHDFCLSDWLIRLH